METVCYRGRDGLERRGIFHDHGQRALVVASHGLFSWKGDQTGKLALLAELLRHDGISLFRFDHIGCGESGGEFSQSTLAARIDDLDEAVKMLMREGRFCEEQPLFLVGSSFGGPVVLVYAARRKPAVRGIVTWSSPIALGQFYRERHAALAEKLERGEMVRVEQDGRFFTLSPAFIESLEAIDPIAALAALEATPLLIIHGTEDETVPLRQAELLRKHYPGQCSLEVISGAHHRLLEHFDLVGGRTRQWILEQLSEETL